MNRLRIGAFAALVVATVGAFFVTQHLKVKTPLLNGLPAPVPGSFDPVDGVTAANEPRSCWLRQNGVRQPVDYRQTFITFYLQHHSDHVAVYVVDTAGTIVRTITSNRYMRKNQRNPRNAFVWNGLTDTHKLAPDGTYYYRVALLGQGRTVQINRPITIVTTPPRPVVEGVSALPAPANPGREPVLITPTAPVTPTGGTGATGATGATSTTAAPSPKGIATKAMIRYSGDQHLGGRIRIFRTDLAGPPQLVFSFQMRRRGDTAVWNGLIQGRPAPAGTYLIGMRVTNGACTAGYFPAESPPVPGTTTHAGVTVRYLAVEPPMTPTPAGGTATVLVDSRQRPYRWALRLVGSKQILTRGSADQFSLPVRMPTSGSGLYELAIRSGPYRTVVPVVASAPPGAQPHDTLVVLPALSWQGLNPIDDDGDGIPNTLANGGPIELARPLTDGLPAGFSDESSLLAALNQARFHYDLTTDLGLLADPSLLKDHRGVVLAGSELWLPTQLRTELRTFVSDGGHVLSLGENSLRRGVTVSGNQASSPTAPAATDAFGARPGGLITNNKSFVIKFADPLRLFSTSSGVFSGLDSFQTLQPPAGAPASIAGTTQQAGAIIGFDLGRGLVIEIGLPDFGARVLRSADLKELLARCWQLLGS